MVHDDRLDDYAEALPSFDLPTAEALGSILKTGAWPDPKTDIGGVYERRWRPRIQALKFVGAYRQRWKAMVDECGEDAVYAAVQHYRKRIVDWHSPDPEMGRAAGTEEFVSKDALLALWGLTTTVQGVEIHAVDPESMNDFGLPPLPNVAAIDPWGVLGYGGAWPIAELPHGSWVPPGPKWPLVPVIVDLRHTDTIIHEDLRRIRKTYGIRATRRIRRAGSWEQLRAAFEVLRAQEQSPKTPLSELWAGRSELARGDPDPETLDRSMYRALKAARGFIDEMTAAVETPEVFDVPPPPGLLWEADI